MGACMWATYRQKAGISVPAPADGGDPDTPWWYDHLASQMRDLASAGYTAILLPPVLKAQGGSGKGCDGYGVYDDYDIGSKNQQGGVPTRFGTREQLLRLCAIAAANGLDVYHDMVPHQRIGGNYATYRYVGADGKTLNGRFPKNPGCFWNGDPRKGYATRDPIAGPTSDDFAFGDAISRVNHGADTPAGYMQRELIAAGDWLFRTTGAAGCRIDDTKGQNAGMVKQWATSRAMAGKFMIGEFADGNAWNLNAAVHNSIFDANNPGTDGVVGAFDFALHYNQIKAMCEGAGRYDMRNLFHGGFAGMDPFKAGTFVDNPDTDTNGFAQVAFNKAAGYFLIMTTPGYPFVYYKDRSHDAGCYGLQASIDNYVWIQRVLASGDIIERYADHDLFVYERTGGRRLLCGINNVGGGWRMQWVQTGFGPNVLLHDYTGHADDVWTNEQGWALIGFPPNVNGLGTVAYAPAGLDRAVQVEHRTCTQTIFGADDLDVPGLTVDETTTAGRIWCAKDAEIWLNLTVPKGTAARIRVQHPDGTLNLCAPMSHVRTTEKGWYTLEVSRQAGVSSATTVPFELLVTYTAPRGL